MSIFSFGVAYYPDYLYEGQLARNAQGQILAHSVEQLICTDLQRMQSLGIEVIRMGEFSWSHVEPQAGQIDFTRLQLTLDRALQYGIKVVLCTPTATPPKWLCDREPSILPKTRAGRTIGFGGRRHYDPASQVYQRESLRITQLYVEALGQHPALIGWQIDNEFGHHGSWQSFTEDCLQHFRRWLQQRYRHDIASLNQEWFTCFWSQHYADFEEIDLPHEGWNSPNPHLEMEFRRFMTAVYVDFQEQQLKVIRAGSPGRWLTHNLIPKMFDLCLWKLTASLDLVGYDHYQLDAWPDPAYSASQFNLMRSLKHGQKFLVLEQQPVQVNWQPVNRRLTIDWLLLWGAQAAFLGAAGMYYFSWRRFAGGSEQFHDAIVPHDLRVEQSRQEQMIKAKKALFELLAQHFQLSRLPDPTAQVLMICNMESIWAHENPQQSLAWQAVEQFDKIHQAFMALSVGIDCAESIAAAADRLACYRVLVLPAYAFALTEQERAILDRFVHQGGRLLTLPRTGFKDSLSKMVPFPLHLFGQNDFCFDDFGALGPEEREKIHFRNRRFKNLEAELWCEKLTLAADSPWKALAHFADGPYKASPAIIRRADFGQGGAAIHLTFWPVLSEALVDFLQTELLVEVGIRTTVEARVQVFPLQLDQRQFQAVINFSEAEVQLAVPSSLGQLQRALVASLDDDLKLQTKWVQLHKRAKQSWLKLPKRAIFFGEWMD